MVLSPTSGFPSHHTPTVWYTVSGNNSSATHVGNWKPEPRGLEFKMFRATALEVSLLSMDKWRVKPTLISKGKELTMTTRYMHKWALGLARTGSERAPVAAHATGVSETFVGNLLDSTIKITKTHSNLHRYAVSISERIHKKLVSLATSKKGSWETSLYPHKMQWIKKLILNSPN